MHTISRGKETAVQCSKCAADLSDGAQVCANCGQPVTALVPSAAAPPAVVLICSQCGAKLPEDAQFCHKCGHTVAPTAESALVPGHPVVAEVLPPPVLRRPHKQRWVPWVVLAGFVLVLLWLLTSDNSLAQQVQELAGLKHDEAVLDTPFPVAPGRFQDYKFSLPEGSVNVGVVGQFAVSGEGPSQAGKAKAADNDIEVYLLTEPAFAVWQKGYATDSIYESGRLVQGTVQVDLPPGAGVYYLVFSNKFAPKTTKSVHATISLRYRSWLPESMRRVKTRVLNWIDI